MPATATNSSLLAAIIAKPDDDAVRLKYAAFLEHKDSERAELIRIQVELTHLPPWDRRAALLRLRERILLIRNGETWRAELPKLAGITWGKFERGFVSDVTVADLGVLTKRLAAIRAATPLSGLRLNSSEGVGGKGSKAFSWLHSLRLDPTCAIGRVIDSGLCDHVTHLGYAGPSNGNEPILAVTQATHLTGLRELDFSGCGIDDAGAAALAGAKHLGALRLLRLRLSASRETHASDLHLTARGIRTLAGSTCLTRLTTLDVGNQRLTDDAVKAVLTGPAFAHLETISFTGSPLTARAFEVPAGPMRLRDVDFSQCVLGEAGVVALAKLPQFSEVCRLNLRSCDVSAKGATALAHSHAAPTIRELQLGDNPLRPSGLDDFAGGRWTELHTLNLSVCGLGPEAIKTLSAAKGIRHLLDLDLSGNEVGAAAAIVVARAPWSRDLVRLGLANCKCAAGAVLARASHLRKLQYLDLTGNPLNAVGIKALMEGEWAELTDLKLGGTNATNEGIKAIADAKILPRLVTLTLGACGFTTEGLAALLTEPAPTLVQLDLSHNPELGDDAIGLLTRASLPALRYLSIIATGLTDKGLQPLLETPLLAQLIGFDFHGNPLTPELEQSLRDAPRAAASIDLTTAGLPLGIR